MSEDALIGSTGFIGGTLLRARSFDACFNSANVKTMRNREFRTVVCAGARAEKWKANREPEIDRAGIDALCDVLETVKAERFVLISTVDVFTTPWDVDELSDVSLDGFSSTSGAAAVNAFASALEGAAHDLLENGEKDDAKAAAALTKVAMDARAFFVPAQFDSIVTKEHGIEEDGDLESHTLIATKLDGSLVVLSYTNFPF